jgi:hypothetical protein
MNVWLQLTSLQSKKARSLNSSSITFNLIISNNAPRPFDPPHHSSFIDELAFAGGMLVLQANKFWAASAVMVPRIQPQKKATVQIMTRPCVGFKTFEELDVDARFELYSDTSAKTKVPCMGTFSTDGAIWNKSAIEFAGDVLYARPKTPNRTTINVLFAGAVPQSGTSSLVNTAFTTLSFSKHILTPAVAGLWKNESANEPQESTILCVSRYKPCTEQEEYEDDSTCDPDEEDDKCHLRLLDVTSANVTKEKLLMAIKGAYDITNDVKTVEDPSERECDAVVFAVPAAVLMSGSYALQESIDTFRALARVRRNTVIAITFADLVSNTHAELVGKAKQLFGANYVFVTRVYRDEEKRTAEIEKPILSLLLSATRQVSLKK